MHSLQPNTNRQSLLARIYGVATVLLLLVSFTLVSLALELLPAIYIRHLASSAFVVVLLMTSLTAATFCFWRYTRYRAKSFANERKLDHRLMLAGFLLVGVTTTILLGKLVISPPTKPFTYLDTLAHGGQVYHLEARRNYVTGGIDYQPYVCDFTGLICRNSHYGAARVRGLGAPPSTEPLKMEGWLRYNPEIGKIEYGSYRLPNRQGTFSAFGVVLP